MHSRVCEKVVTIRFDFVAQLTRNGGGQVRAVLKRSRFVPISRATRNRPRSRFSLWRGFMALGSQPRWTVRPADAQVGIDVGLREYMLRVYNYMASGLALTGIVAYVFAQYLFANPALLRSPVMFLIMLAPLGLVMLMSFGIQRMQASTAQMIFWLYAGVMGLSLATVFLYFTGASIARVFFITAGTFAAMSLYGYTTQR